MVDWAMRYGEPPIAERLSALTESGCDRILVFPLYPQYSATTTATVNDKAFAALKTMRLQPSVRTVPPYYDEPVYIDALAESIEPSISNASTSSRRSCSLPITVCRSHTSRRATRITAIAGKRRGCFASGSAWREDRLITTFQSRFGPEEWLQPYTDKTVERLASEGVRRIAIVNPGFVSDCLETLEEIAVQNREIFLHTGGEHFAHIPCLNDSPEGMRVITTIVLRELQGWI